MRGFIGVIATCVFALTTLGMMLHCAAWVLGYASLSAALGWLIPIGFASLGMAVTGAPTPVWERDLG